MELRLTKSTYTIILFTIVAVIIIKEVYTMKNDQLIKIAFSNPWNTTIPYLQHTSIGDMVISNAFDALVGISENGEFAALGAKSWTINKDFTEIKFIIDTDRTFSDGSKLTSNDFKKSWEYGLSQVQKSNNSSLLDVLYKLKGFQDFEVKGHIEGIKTPSPSELILEFDTPFRMALEHLTGTRFSAYKIINDQYIGTGQYILKEHSKQHITFTPRKKGLPTLDVIYMPGPSIEKALESDDVDVIHQNVYYDLSESFFEKRNLTMILGHEAAHRVFSVNTKKGVFSKKNNRKALQFLVLEYLKNSDSFSTKYKALKLSAQYYVDFQKGHLPENNVEKIISNYEKFVPEFIEECRKTPLIVYENTNFPILPILEKYKIPISDLSRVIGDDEYFNVLYNVQDFDVMGVGFSVNTGDPDGIYHFLGKNGAIITKFSVNDKVSNELEMGRKLLDPVAIENHYTKLAEMLIEELPVVHAGFLRRSNIYRNDKIKINSNIVNRNDGHLNKYEFK